MNATSVVAIAECGVDMIEEAPPEAARIDGLPRERVDSGSGEPVPCRSDQGCAGPRSRRHRRPPPSLRQGGRHQGAGQPGQQHRRANVEADVGDPNLYGRVPRGEPREQVDALFVERRAPVDEAADRRIVGGDVGPHRRRRRRRPA